jgi:hypothetical protein
MKDRQWHCPRINAQFERNGSAAVLKPRNFRGALESQCSGLSFNRAGALRFNGLQRTNTDFTGLSDKLDASDSLQVIEKMERETRIELATNSLEGCDSTIELLPLR